MDHTGRVYEPGKTFPLGQVDGPMLEGLEPPCRTALLLAVLAEDCDQWALVEATSAVLGGPVDLDVLDPVVARGLAVVETGRVRVPRDDVRRAVSARALPSEQQGAHRALASVLHDDPLAAAWHGTHAIQTRDAEAAELALSAARLLQRKGRPRQARTMLEHAARLSTTSAARAACLLEAGAVAFALGLPAEARDLVDLAERTGLDVDLVALPHLLRATFLEPAPRHRTGTALEVVEAARKFHSWGLTCLTFSVLIATEHRAVPQDMVVGADCGSPVLDALVALQMGDLPEAARLLTLECPRLAAAGLRGVETHARAVLAQTVARTGDLTTAANEVVETHELAWATRQPSWATHVALTSATIATMRGDTDGASKVTDLERTVLVGEHDLRPGVELVHALALISNDQWSDAHPVLVRLARRVSHSPELLTAGLLGYLAEAAVHTDQVAPTRELVSRIGAISPTCVRGAELADLLLATAVLAPDDRAEACFAVVQSLDPGRWPWVRARADLAHGAWLRRGRRVGQARPHLLSAQRLFTALDAPVWQRRAHTELRAAGVRVTMPAPTVCSEDVAERLSPQELAIVRLAAEGLSNRQIGDRLFLSPRTIGSHLYRIFPKLDITSRHQLTGLVAPG